MPYRLVPQPNGAAEVGELLQALMAAFEKGELSGLAVVAGRKRQRFFSEIVGSCVTNPTLARGAVMELSDKLATLQHQRDVNETR